jgi:hypothetical protein
MRPSITNERGVLDLSGNKLSGNEAATAVYYPVLLLSVPLLFSTAIHRFYALPKFIALLTGSAIILCLLVPAWAALAESEAAP